MPDLSGMNLHTLTQRHEQIGAIIVDAAYKVHKYFGPGLLEKVYETCLCYEIQQAGLEVNRQVKVPLRYKGLSLDEVLRLDLLVENMVVVETKAVDLVNPVWHAQLVSQLRVTGHQLGFLINFNVPLIRDGIKRIINTVEYTRSV